MADNTAALMIPCPHPHCKKTMLFRGDFVFALVVGCICGACKLALRKGDDGSVWVGRALPWNIPARKGDWIVLEHTTRNACGPMTHYYTALEVGRGGRKPRERNGSPIDLDRAVAVVREWRRAEMWESAEALVKREEEGLPCK